MSNQTAKPGESYLDDNYYRPLEAAAERKHGLPDGLLGRIRKLGERTNRSVVQSETGARSVWQIVPKTRDLFMKAHGVNAFAGDREAAEVAALHLNESLDRGKDVTTAIREYHGGPNPARWGKINRAYVARVTGKPVPGIVNTEYGTTAMAPGLSFDDLNPEDYQGVAPADIGAGGRVKRKPVTAEDLAPKPTAASVILGPLAGREITPGSQEADATMDRVQSNNNRTAYEADQANAPSWIDTVRAAVDENWIGNQIIRGLDNEADRPDAAWAKKFADNYITLTADAQDEDERDMLSSPMAQATEAGYNKAKQAMLARRERIGIINSGDYGWAYSLGAAALDPAGWVATYGVGKAFQLGRVGIAGLKGTQATKAGLLGSAAEGAVGNVAFTGALDYSGESQSVGDYLSSAALGAGMMAAMYGASSVLGKLDDVAGVPEEAALTARETIADIEAEAITRLGPNPSPAAVDQEMQAVLADRAEQQIKYSVGPRADTDRFLPDNDELLRTSEKPVAIAAITRNNLEFLPDPAERAMGAEMAVRGEEIVAAAEASGDLAKGLDGKFLRAFPIIGNQESDALTMLRSGSTLMKAMAIQLLESTTGAGGRKASAAMAVAQRNRLYMNQLSKYENSFQIWAEGEGIGKIKRMADNDARAAFDRQVTQEIRSRSPERPFVTTNESVRSAADALEEGFDRMRREMQEVKALGHERLGDNSKGYFPQIINPAKLLGLSKAQEKSVVAMFAKQFRELNEYSYVDRETGETIKKNFDKEFADKLARRYVDEAKGRAMGSSYVPANLHTGEAAGILKDAVKAMSGLTDEEQAAILGRFSRGGATFTKGRLTLDMTAEIGDGMLMGDLFEQDVLTAYRRYARRMAGEVSLAQYGIMGRSGLDLARRVAEKQGATVDELKAFERVASEFLNEPWGKAGPAHNGSITAMRNLSTLTRAARLGMMPFTQLGESGNAIPVLGVKAVLSAMTKVPAYAKEIKQFLDGKPGTNPLLKDFDDLYGFVGGDGYNMTRLFDAPDQAVELYDKASIGVFTKAIRAGAHATSIISGYRVLHATQVRGMSENIVRKAIKFIKEGSNDVHMRDMGLTDEMRAELSRHLDQIATFDKKGRLTKLDIYAAPIDPRIMRDFAQVIERGASQIIQKTYIGETGPWAHDEFLKFLFTFRTFGITSIEKQFGRNMTKFGGGAEAGVKTFAIMLGSMAFALPIHMARLQAQSLGMSEAEREKFYETRMTAAAVGKSLMNYTSVTGLAPDAYDVISTFGVESGILPESIREQVDVKGRQVGLTGLIAPVGYANDLLQGTVGARFEKLPKLLPGSNTPLAMPIFNLVSEDEE